MSLSETIWAAGNHTCTVNTIKYFLFRKGYCTSPNNTIHIIKGLFFIILVTLNKYNIYELTIVSSSLKSESEHPPTPYLKTEGQEGRGNTTISYQAAM